MSLEELNQHLHSNKDYEDVHRSHDVDNYNPFDQQKTREQNPFLKEQEWKEPQKGLTLRQKKILKIVGVALLALVLLGIALWGWNEWKANSFHEDRVAVSFDGPKEADSTQQVEYAIKYTNDNLVTLHNVEITLSYTENFQPIDNVNFKYLSKTSSKIYVGDIKAKSSAAIPMKGIFYAPKNSQVYLRASLGYSVSGKSESFASSGQLGVNVDTAPILLDVLAPKEASDGDSIEYVIDFKNLDSRSLVDTQVRVEFPTGFSFLSSNPSPSEGSGVWYIGALESDQGGNIRIQGKLNGIPDEGKTLKVSLGKMGDDGNFVTYSQQTMNTRMVAAALSIKQSVFSGANKGIIKPGSNVAYVVNYTNNSNIGMRNSIVTVEISSEVVDYSSLSVEKGAFDGSRSVITWKASDVPDLANIQPGATGELRFSLPIKSIIPVENAQDRNYTVRTIAKIDSPDIPSASSANKIIGSSTLELKLGSKVVIDTLGYFEDANIKNSGPIPMKVGSETTFTMHWTIMNVSNELQNAVLTSSLPTGYRWTGKIFPESENIQYDNRTNIIKWTIGGINPGVGILEPKKEISFQIGVTPQANQVAKTLILLNQGTFAAKDTFTGEDINIEIQAKDSQLREDVSMPTAGYRVQ